MSNVTAVRSNRDELYIRGANGAEWTLTRAEIQAIWQSKSGTPAQRKAAAIADILSLATAALGDQAGNPTLDFDPTDTLAALRLELH